MEVNGPDDPVTRHRIALLHPGGVLGQIVRTAVEQEPELELVPLGESLLPAGGQPARIELLIMVLPGREAVSECRELLALIPGLRILAVLEDERGDGSLFELRPRETRLGALSPPELAQRIRVFFQEQPSPPSP